MRSRLPLAAAFAAACAALLVSACDEKIVGGDTVPPDVSITAPDDGAPVGGVGFWVEIEATDDVGVDRVEVAVADGSPVTLSAPPYRAHVVTLGIEPGPAAVRVEAFDAAGNSDIVQTSVDVAARTLTKLTTDPQDDLNPAWSSDGTQIVFQSDRGSGEFNIWTMDADGSGATQLTTNVNEDRNPAWSPEGDWIAFDSDRAGTFDIWRMPIVGGEAAAENLTFGNNDDVEPAWSPDGADLFFASNRGDDVIFNIWRQPVASGTASPVTALANEDRAPAVSSGGFLAFTTTLLGAPHVYTRTAGGTVVPLTGDAGVVEADPAWAPGGSVVTFTRSEGLDGNLWFKPLDPDAPVVQGTFGSGTLGDGGAAWHPEGDRIAFHSDRDGNLDIWVVE